MVSGTLWFSSHSIKIICKSKYRNLKMWNIHTERKGVTNIFKNKICLENLISRSFSWNFGINSNVMLCYCRDTRHKIRSFFSLLQVEVAKILWLRKRNHLLVCVSRLCISREERTKLILFLRSKFSSPYVCILVWYVRE